MLVIYHMPEKHLTYVLAADVATGIGADFSEIVVLCTEPVFLAAHYRDNWIKPMEFGVKCWQVGAFYNFGLLGVERNAIGLGVLDVLEHGHPDRRKYPQLKRYPKLFYETRTDKKTREETKRLGFTTGKKSKERAILKLSELIRDDEVTLNSVPLIQQMAGFTINPESNKFVQTYKDPETQLYADDGVMTLVIANEMRLHQWKSRFFSEPEMGDW